MVFVLFKIHKKAILIAIALGGLALVLLGADFYFNEHRAPASRHECPEGMVRVEGGDVQTLWTSDIKEGIVYYQPVQSPGNGPPENKRRIAPFCMDQFEYPNKKGVFPKHSVPFLEAKNLCEQGGKRLCLEDEWELVCLEPPGDILYSFVVERIPDQCNTRGAKVGDSLKLAPSGRFPHCRTKSGVYDLNGNLSEMVMVENMFRKNRAIVRGGTMWMAVYGQSCFSRHAHQLNQSIYPDDGFRCCADLPKSGKTP